MECGGASAKAYFRRGQGHKQIEDFEQARKDFVKAREIEPSDRGIEVELRQLDQLARKHRQKEKQQFAGMFGKATVDAEEVPAPEATVDAEAAVEAEPVAEAEAPEPCAPERRPATDLDTRDE